MHPAPLLATLILTLPAAGLGDPLPRLLLTPAERAQVEGRTPAEPRAAPRPRPAAEPGPVRFDGLVIRADGHAVYWVDGRIRSRAPEGLKPGQMRDGSKIYEAYAAPRP